MQLTYFDNAEFKYKFEFSISQLESSHNRHRKMAKHQFIWLYNHHTYFDIFDKNTYIR